MGKLPLSKVAVRGVVVAARRSQQADLSKETTMRRNSRLNGQALAGLAGICLALPAVAGEGLPGNAPAPAEAKHYSPYVDQTFPNRVLWGCTHIHTALSADAGLMGVTLGPADMFRFAWARQSPPTSA